MQTNQTNQQNEPNQPNQTNQTKGFTDDDNMRVINRHGDMEEISFDEIKHRISKLINFTGDGENIDEQIEQLSHVSASRVTLETIPKLFDGITTRQLDIESAKVCASLEFVHYNYGILGGRILASDLFKHLKSLNLMTFTSRLEYLNERLTNFYSQSYVEFVLTNKDVFNSMIKLERNFLLTYFGFKTLEKSYLVKVNSEPIETPQDVFLRVAIAIHYRSIGKNGNSLKQIFSKIKNTYDLMSLGYFTHATPTLFNAGTGREQLSSCFLLGTEDSLNGIFKTISDVANISKWAGGIGVHVSNIRGKGSLITSTNGTSDGIIPMLKVYNEVGRYINQGGKRKGSIAVYLEPWHTDVESFLELKLQTGAETERARDLFLALWIPDEFMRRLQNDEDWYLMCPSQSPGLSDVYDSVDNKAFTDLYNKYIAEGKYTKKVKAKELFNKALISQIETGVPYILFKDNVNRKSNQSNIGIVKSSNLCCEITEVSNASEYAVCNLASIAVNKFVKLNELKEYDLNDLFEPYHTLGANTPNSTDIIMLKQQLFELLKTIYDFDKLRHVSRTITENLNNVIDHNFYPVGETEKSNLKNRPIGIGIQGLGDLYYILNLPYSSYVSKYIDALIMEAIYYESVSASSDIAFANGVYETYQNSPFQQGKLQFDLWEDEGKFAYKKIYPQQMQWTALKDKIARQGMRNSLLTSLMPTASTSQILGNNECFEPYSSIVYKRTTLAGQFKVVNKHFVDKLIEHNLWSDGIRNLIINSDGSIKDIALNQLLQHTMSNNYSSQNMDKFNLPKLKEVYKTIWEIKQKDVIDHALARSPYIDQSQSMNLFFAEPNSEKQFSALVYGWKNGIKTGCYYLRSLPATEAIKYTTTNNKSQVTDKAQAQTVDKTQAQTQAHAHAQEEECTTCSA